MPLQIMGCILFLNIIPKSATPLKLLLLNYYLDFKSIDFKMPSGRKTRRTKTVLKNVRNICFCLILTFDVVCVNTFICFNVLFHSIKYFYDTTKETVFSRLQSPLPFRLMNNS